MSHNRILLGAQQWLIVGALAQSPTQALPVTCIYEHMAPWLYPVEVRRIIARLIAMGVVEAREGELVFALTAHGANVRRESRKTRVPAYWPLVLAPGVILE